MNHRRPGALRGTLPPPAGMACATGDGCRDGLPRWHRPCVAVTGGSAGAGGGVGAADAREGTMHARIGKAELEPGRMEEAVTIWREQVMPRLRQQPGFRGALVLGDGRTTAEAITLWESEADAQAAGTAMQVAIGQLGGPLAHFPEREAYTVYLDERA